MAKLVRSSFLSYFAHMGDAYLYHDLYGYIMQMSPDVIAFLDEFAEPQDPAEVVARHAGDFDGQAQTFVDTFSQFSCLIAPAEDERAGIFYTVPVKGRWNVWVREGDRVTLYAAWGDRAATKVELDEQETAMWDAFDGETTLSMLAGDFPKAALGALVERLVHHDVQALKLSPLPLSTFKTDPRMKPPYLTSTMPYAPYRPGVDPAPQPYEGTFAPTEYYEREVADAAAQFDDKETTLSHLLRVPHPALGGRTYGAALIDALAGRGMVPDAGERVRVLEIGAGLGYVARAVIEALRGRGLDVTYEIVELSPALAAAQRERLGDLGVTVREGDCLTIDLPEASYDLVISNEMIGDLPAAKLTHAEAPVSPDLDEAERERRLDALGEVGALLRELELPILDAPDPFYLNVGAIELVRRIHRWLAPGGAAVVTEFGEPGRYPRLSTHLDHPELSIHFNHLLGSAQRFGFRADMVFVIDLLEIDRTLEGMATTRSYFRALQAALAERGVALEKIGYTRDMLDALLGGAVEPGMLGELRFDRIEDRLMGLVPHEFKALLLNKSGGGASASPAA